MILLWRPCGSGFNRVAYGLADRPPIEGPLWALRTLSPPINNDDLSEPMAQGTHRCLFSGGLASVCPPAVLLNPLLMQALSCLVSFSFKFEE